jgi:hypothetical protein
MLTQYFAVLGGGSNEGGTRPGPVRGANPFWDRVGVTIADPDRCRIVLVAGTWPS